tara:strand:- start:2517 stop:3629 length:1113 start_codon:yes stop_codon:yes gene_type:complete
MSVREFVPVLVLFALVVLGIFKASYEIYMQDQVLKAQLEIRHWNTRRTRAEWVFENNHIHTPTRPLHLCPSVQQRKRFAIASMLTRTQNKEDFYFYQLGAAKLASSIHLWSPHVLGLVDLVLLIATDNATHPALSVNESLLHNAGWSLCHTAIIESPDNDMLSMNRFLQAHMFSRLRMWQLIQYDAVLSIDVDAIVISDISILFVRHYPIMKRRNLTLGAVGDGLLLPCTNANARRSATNFNAGVILLQPDMNTFRRLVNTIHSQAYTKEMAEQSLLNHVYSVRQYYQLPYTFNTHLGNIYCNERVKDASILHYIGAPKPWSLRRGFLSCAPYDLNCWKTHVAFCNMPLGAYLAGTTHMSLAWEMIPTAV